MKNELSELTEAISAALPSMTKLESRIASYILARPQMLLVETSAEIARTLGVSPMTVTRFYRKLGFDGAIAVRAAARRTAFGPETRRIDQRFASAAALRQSIDWRADVELGHAAIGAAFALRESPGWQPVVD
ncbi:MAG: MurR/RpiR family transcriptional regulator, partial [Paracoccaceae bacterium]